MVIVMRKAVFSNGKVNGGRSFSKAVHLYSIVANYATMTGPLHPDPVAEAWRSRGKVHAALGHST